jgi:RNA polymerase sigma-70 factor (ECF subfamily)
MIEEKDLVQQVQNGNRNAFRQLVEEYKRKVYYLAYDLTGNHMDADDLSQEVFIRIFNSIANFRRESKFSTWIYRVTINCWINMKKSKGYKIREKQDRIDNNFYLNEQKASEQNPQREAEKSDIQKFIHNALQQLSPKEKSVFIMRHYHDLSLKEIGTTLNIRVGTVKSLLFRAINKLQKQLSGHKNELSWEEN